MFVKYRTLHVSNWKLDKRRIIHPTFCSSVCGEVFPECAWTGLNILNHSAGFIHVLTLAWQKLILMSQCKDVVLSENHSTPSTNSSAKQAVCNNSHISATWLTFWGIVVSFTAAGLPRCRVTFPMWLELSLQEGAAVLALIHVRFVKQLHFCQGLVLSLLSPPKLELWVVSPWELIHLFSVRWTWSLWIGRGITFELTAVMFY